ncbi:sensor histidine kinase [Actinokineospora enzanensis]|uniref:sensor histidine kinase n=1 Tax=Actinokineospora enzanensis TaxID=155975 RepID=UPI0003A5C154|nr:ATP-binding protein [Actinokineospora enzanensis]
MSTGSVERLLGDFRYRYVGTARAIIAVLSAAVAVPVAPWDGRTVTGVLALALVTWQVVYLPQTRMRPGWWVLPADFALVVGLALTQRWTVPPEYLTSGFGWVSVVVSITVIAYQWHFRRLAGAAGVTVLLAAAYAIGAGVAMPETPGVGVPLALWLLVEGALSRGLFELVRKAARHADLASTRNERARTDAESDRMMRADDEEYLATLHDTVAGTLQWVGDGVFDRPARWLSERARSDLAQVAGTVHTGVSVDAGAFAEMVGAVAAQAVTKVNLVVQVSRSLRERVASALCWAMREALANVARHARVDVAEVAARETEAAVVVTVVDRGVGFDLATVPADRHGLTRSIRERMRRVGGAARIESGPGAGTTVQLTWPEREETQREEPLSARRLLRGLRIATVCIATAVLVGRSTPTLLANLDVYLSPAGEIGGYVILLAVAAVTAFAIVRDLSLGPWAPALAVVVLAVSIVATAGVPPEHLITPVHWSYETVGWFATAVLLHRPLRELLAFQATFLTCALAQVALAGQFDQPTLARLITISVAIIGFQVTTGACGQSLSALAAEADAETEHADELRARNEIEEQLHARRRARHADLMPTIAPLLSGLADESLDPGDESVRKRCLVEAARVRRLLAERGDDDPVSAELRPGIEQAGRRGVVVDVVLAGARPTPPPQVVRELTEPILVILSLARTSARITIDGAAGRVTASARADSPPVDLLRPDGLTMHVDHFDGLTWVEVGWTSG